MGLFLFLFKYSLNIKGEIFFENYVEERCSITSSLRIVSSNAFLVFFSSEHSVETCPEKKKTIL